MFKKILFGFLLAAGLGIGAYVLWQSETGAPAEQSYIPQGEQGMVGASIPVSVTRFQTSLQSSITSSASSMTLVSGTDSAGNSLSGFTCFTIDEGTSVAEDVCGTAAGTSVTSLIRGISPTTGTSSVTSLKFAHRRGASVKITDAPQIPVLSRILNGSETLPNPLKYDVSVSTTTISSNTSYLASVAYVNGVAIAGAPDASTAAKGIVQAATASQLQNGTGTGGTGALLFAPGSFFNATSSATTLIPVTKANGKLSQTFFDFTESWNFNTATTTSTTADAMNLLPAGSIQMYATSTAPAGWLLADGSSYATSSYPRLFAVIGYTYGGSAGTFNLPNFSGRNPVGRSSTATPFTSIGNTGGATTTILTQANLPAMNFLVSGGTSDTRNGGAPDANYGQVAAGSATPFGILDPYLVVNFIIKY